MQHIGGYVLFGGLVRLALQKWKGVGRRPIAILYAGMAMIILAANLVENGMSF